MIDTLRFKIELSLTSYSNIRTQCCRFHKTNPNGLSDSGDLYYDNLKFGAMDYKVRVSLPIEKLLFIELSIPKYANGHNISLFPISDVCLVLDDLKYNLEKHFNVKLPDYMKWIIKRLDLCYIWI